MPNTAITAAADVAGRALATITDGIARIRPADKPLHPEGVSRTGRLVRPGSDDPVGVPWFDLPGEDEVLVRMSHAIGLPGRVPDIDGLAIRLRKGQTRYADLLLASTGWDRVTRHLLVPALRQHQPLTTLLPYRSPVGPVVIGARPVGGRGYDLHWARLGRAWRPLGTLTLDLALPEEAETSFDPVLNLLPGLQQYDWVEHLRERSYATARRRRRQDG
jgi:hypothetical protein